MPDSIENNQREPQQSGSPNNQNHEHETHGVALTLLALATLVIVVVVLILQEEVNSLNPGTYNNKQVQVDQESHGSVIPATNVQTEEVTNFAGFPEGLINIPESAEIKQNVSVDVGDGRTVRTLAILRNKQSPPALLYAQYHEWLDASRFDITDTTESATKYTIDARAENADSVSVKISAKNDGVRVQINYLTQN